MKMTPIITPTRHEVWEMEWSASAISDEIASLKPDGTPPTHEWELFWRQPDRAVTGIMGPVHKWGFF